jgi:hypothetical protein
LATSFLDSEPTGAAVGGTDVPAPGYWFVEAGSAACGHWFSVIVALFSEG